MASIKELRSRIASLEATRKITKAMQMVAAAKLRRSQESAKNARPYAERMARAIANLAASVSGADAPTMLVGTGSDQRELVVVATSDRGLAGGFNAQVVRFAREHVATRLAAGKDVRLLTIGRKARDQLKRPYANRSVAAFEAGANPTLERAIEVSKAIEDLFAKGEVDVVTLFFNRFRSVVSQTPTLQRLVPAGADDGAPVNDLGGAVYEYEPDAETILAAMLPRYLTSQVFSAMLENQAGFFAAQMAAMDNATRNAGDIIASLTLLKNRTRQAQITKELIEIISGAEAL